jgi:hypothetical protein
MYGFIRPKNAKNRIKMPKIEFLYKKSKLKCHQLFKEIYILSHNLNMQKKILIFLTGYKSTHLTMVQKTTPKGLLSYVYQRHFFSPEINQNRVANKQVRPVFGKKKG